MKNKYGLLVRGIIFDLIGMFSYAFPMIGEYSDVVWAPIASYLLYKMYPGKQGKIGSIIVFLEELIPFIDVIPTFTITWFYTFYFEKEQNEVIKK